MADLFGSSYITLIFAPLFSIIERRYLMVVSVVSLGMWRFLYRRSKKKWRVHFGGTVSSGFEKVEQVFRQNIASHQDQGGAFSVFYRGKLVVDLWGGYADHEALRYRHEDSISMVYSATKGVTAVCMALLVDRGLLDYKAPVCKYWPEFAQKDKDHITVETLLSHRAGLVAIREKHTLALLRDDPKKLEELLAKQEPFWTPGTAQGYHTLTLGLYADFLLRKVDEKGRTLGQFFQEEIATPFGVDFFIGAPKSIHHRACRESRASFGLLFFFTTTIPTATKFVCRAIYSLLKYRTIYLLNLVGNPTDWRPRRLNNPEFREIGCGSSHGFGTARGLAKLMGILANGGKHDGRTLLSSELIDRLNTPLTSEFDRVILCDKTYGPGTIIKVVDGEALPQRRIFGHWGAGGQVIYCDTTSNLGWAYTTNFSNILHGFIIDHRYSALEAAMYQCVSQLVKSE